MSKFVMGDIGKLLSRYAAGELTPTQMVKSFCEQGQDDPHHVWIHRLSNQEMLAYASAVEKRGMAAQPLYGIPFAIKDNIDLAGVPTTAGCPGYSYVPERSAAVVQRLLDAGAIPVGKTNLDQFATGLNGTRSPYGACRNAYNPDYISGGSSSGSAVALAMGQVCFSLGTDTAGSGRVPAAFNNLLGVKPTCGLLSTSGVVPACRSLDSVSIFALNADDAQRVLAVASGFDPTDPYSRSAQPHGFDFGRATGFTFGVPQRAQLKFFGDREAERLFDQAVAKLDGLGGKKIEIDFAPFLETARLLYEGAWVAERYQAIRTFIEASPQSLFPVTHDIIAGGKQLSAADAFAGIYRLRELKRSCDAVWQRLDCVLTPTAGTLYTVAEMLADPIKLNAELGYYTNFMNLLDYSAIALPGGFTPNGLPFGVTVFAPAHQDVPLLHLAQRWEGKQAAAGIPDAVPSGQVRVAVCGAHLSGLPLNGQLTTRGARLLASTTSSPDYKLYALPGGPPYRPGMVKVAQGGAAIEVEVWEMPASEFGSFVAGIPAPLGIGTLTLANGEKVQGFVCEAYAVTHAEDITQFGGWRAYLARKQAA
ncbi:MAG TPA: allophanate hydrolase [Gallionellaceae bacterium]